MNCYIAWRSCNMHPKTKTVDTSRYLVEQTKFGSLSLNGRTYLKPCKNVSNIGTSFYCNYKRYTNVISTKLEKQKKFRLYNTNIKVGKIIMALVNKHTVVFVWLYNFAVFKIRSDNTQEEEDWDWQDLFFSFTLFIKVKVFHSRLNFNSFLNFSSLKSYLNR